MIFHENCLLADNSHEIAYFFSQKLGKMSENLSSAAVVIGALRVKNVASYIIRGRDKTNLQDGNVS